MSLKERLATMKQSALTEDNIAKQVEDILIKAAKDGESTVVIYLDKENGYKTQAVCQFLTKEGIDFKKAYDSYQTTEFPYIDTHMGGYEGVDPNKQVPVTKYQFKGIRVFLQ